MAKIKIDPAFSKGPSSGPDGRIQQRGRIRRSCIENEMQKLKMEEAESQVADQFVAWDTSSDGHALVKSLFGSMPLANALGGVVLAPIAALPGWLSATIVAAVTGVILLCCFQIYFQPERDQTGQGRHQGQSFWP